MKLEKAEENNNAMGDDYIREVDEYSEETHSDDMYGNGRGKRQEKASNKSKESSSDLKKVEVQTQKQIDEQARNLQKRIN